MKFKQRLCKYCGASFMGHGRANTCISCKAPRNCVCAIDCQVMVKQVGAKYARGHNPASKQGCGLIGDDHPSKRSEVKEKTVASKRGKPCSTLCYMVNDLVNKKLAALRGFGETVILVTKDNWDNVLIDVCGEKAA